MRTDTVMMDQEEHFTEEDQPKFFTRSAARHLRRKRLQDARRAEKQQEYLSNSVNVTLNQECVTEKDADQSEAVTKSKARRLRKKNKTKPLQNCCSYCESYQKNSLPVIETVTSQEALDDKDPEETKTVTKSKARRLRKKNTKLVQNTCSFCYNTYSSPTDSVLLKYIKPAECDSVCCVKHEKESANNLKQNYKPERAVEAQVGHIQYDKQKEQTELKSEYIESERNCSELSCLSKTPGPLKFGNEIGEIRNSNPPNLELASQLKQTIVDTILTKINSTKEDLRLQKYESKQYNNLDNLSNCQNTEFCNFESNKGSSCVLESPSVDPKENTTFLEEETELKVSSESNATPEAVKTAFSKVELLENVKNLRFNDSSEKDLETTTQQNIQIFPDSTKLQRKDIISVVKEHTSTDITEEPLETGSVSNTNSRVVENFSCNPDSTQKSAAATEVETSTTENIEKLLNVTPVLGNVEHDRPAVASLLKLSGKMADVNKANVPEKTREEVKAEREMKKAAKALAKAKAKTVKVQDNKDTSNNKSTLPDNIKHKQSSETLESVTNKNNVEVQDKTPVIDKSSNTSAKNAPLESSNEEKSKAKLRAERRAKQEAQRAAKQQLLQEKSKVKSKESRNDPRIVQVIGDTESEKKAVTPKKTVQKDNIHEINLFKHLYHEREQAIVDVPSVNSNIHPAIVRLGVQYASKVIVGSNARCVALLAAVKQLIRDFERPSQVDFIRGLEATLQKSVAYLHYCRPLAVSMQNALRHLKWQMTQLPSVLSDADAKNKLISAIDTYILEQIELADKAISITIQTKISNGDVILTYSFSSLIHKILLDAHLAGKQFRVIVVDGRPWLEGKEQLRRLAKHGIECSYVLINALSYVMPEVSKVFLGAHAILANGAVMSRAGTAQVALMARAFNIPVLVPCETHKTCERVQTDSIVYNELGNADELAQGYGIDSKKPLLANWKSKKSLNLLNITYDVTPADLVTAVVTELAILPCTSVPVILRIKPSEI